MEWGGEYKIGNLCKNGVGVEYIIGNLCKNGVRRRVQNRKPVQKWGEEESTK